MFPIIQQLIQKGILDKEKAASLELEISNSKKKEEDVLLEKGIISENFLFSLKSENLKIPLKTEIFPEDIPLKVLELIPEESAKYYQMIPLAKTGDILEIGMVYPEDLKAREAIKFLGRQGNFVPQIYLITPTTFNLILKQYKNLKKEVSRALEEFEMEIKTEKTEVSALKKADLERLVEEAPITKVVAVILRHAVEGKASDIHIEPTSENLRIRFRLDGVLYSSLALPKKVHPSVVARIKILSNLKLDETRIPQDGRFSAKIDKKMIDFRVSTFPTAKGEKVAIRVLDPTEGLKGFKDLGLWGRNLEILSNAIKKPYGMILATGPTGSGKTTTLYSILMLLNKEGVNICTLEDPIEYFIEGVNQSQIKPEIGYDFATGLRHLVRQDPDVIMVGEIRDEESAALATHAALTGHIVLSTLHTSNAFGAIPRLFDLGVKPFLIPPSLNIALAQRLVRKLCPECKKKIKPKAGIKELILKEIESLPPQIKSTLPVNQKNIEIYEPVGCKKCRFEGYTGRIAIFEILEMTDRLADIVLKELSESKIYEEGKRQGVITMVQDGIIKALDGVTTIEEVLKVAEEKY